jgi:F-type H+-transporting ATPase subunit alpha
MKQVAGRLRLDLAQYRELEAFAEFGSELDKASQQQLARGARTVELLKQPQYQPMPAEDQVISIWAIANGYTDDLPVSDVRRFESEMHDYLKDKHREIYEHIREQGTLPEDVENTLRDAVKEFKDQFAPSEGQAPKEAEADELEEGEEGQETMKRVRRTPPKQEG